MLLELIVSAIHIKCSTFAVSNDYGNRRLVVGARFLIVTRLKRQINLAPTARLRRSCKI